MFIFSFLTFFDQKDKKIEEINTKVLKIIDKDYFQEGT